MTTRFRIRRRKRMFAGLGSDNRAREVAEIIIQQLGRQALFMMGASSYAAGMFKNRRGNELPGLRFKIKGSKVSYIRIVLNGLDLYDLTFFNRARNEIGFAQDVYVEDLHDLIERKTGLFLSLKKA